VDILWDVKAKRFLRLPWLVGDWWLVASTCLLLEVGIPGATTKRENEKKAKKGKRKRKAWIVMR
jgi:hypothetical protein